MIHFKHIKILLNHFAFCSFDTYWGVAPNFSKLQQNLEKSRLNFLILLMDVPGRISRNQNRRNCVVNWILQILISDYRRGRTGSRQPFENATSPWTSVAGGDPRTGAACRGAWQPHRSSRLCGGFFPPKCGWGSQGRACGFALLEPRSCRHEAFLLVSP